MVSCPVLLPCLPFLTACISWLLGLNENITVGMLIMKLPNVAYFYVFWWKNNIYIYVHVYVCVFGLCILLLFLVLILFGLIKLWRSFEAQLQGTNQDHLQIFNIELKAKIKSYQMPEQVRTLISLHLHYSLRYFYGPLCSIEIEII